MQINYSDINRILQEAEAFADPSQWHGFVCALICTNEYPDQQLWQEFLDLQVDDYSVIESCYSEMYRLINTICEDIQSDDYDFQLLLPNDEEDLPVRVNALASWCDSFLTGMGLSQDNLAEALSENGSEILGDFSKIAQVFVAEDESDTGEEALFELVEYVRMSTMLLYEELRPLSYNVSASRVLH